MPKRKPTYVPPVDLDGNYTVDKSCESLFNKLVSNLDSFERFGAAYRTPPEPPPEEARPIRRYNPGTSPRDANT